MSPATERAILDEAHAAEMRVISEAVACEHHNFSAHTTSGGTFDDTVTQAGECRDCGAWLIMTTYKTSDRFEARVMTAAERDRLERIHEQHRFSDFLTDLQSR